MLSVNPELQKNLWLEAGPRRLILTPLILLAVFYLNVFPTGEVSSLGPISLFLYGLFVLVRGPWQTAESVAGEIRNRTWDFQRMSRISPEKMVLGKLLGANFLNWYVGIPAAAAFVVSIAPTTPPLEWVRVSLLFLFTGLLVHSLAFLLSLQFSRRERSGGRSGSFGIMVLGFLLGTQILNFGLKPEGVIPWYGLTPGAPLFIGLSAALFFLWFLFAAIRLMRLELERRGSFYLYPAFLVFSAVYLFGLFVTPGFPAESLRKGFLSVVLLMAAFFYFMIFAEEKNPVILKRLLIHWRSLARGQGMQDLPHWPVTLPFLFLSTLGTLVSPLFTTIPDLEPALWYPAVAVSLLVVRDCFLFVFFILNDRGRRVEGTIFLYLLIFYGIVPLLLLSAEQSFLLSLLWPLPSSMPLAGISGILLEGAGAALLIRYLWQKRKFLEHRDSPSPGPEM